MKVWIAEQDYDHEGMDMFAVAASKELAMEACQKRILTGPAGGEVPWKHRHVALPEIKWEAVNDAETAFKGRSDRNDYVVYEMEVIGS